MECYIARAESCCYDKINATLLEVTLKRHNKSVCGTVFESGGTYSFIYNLQSIIYAQL